MDVLCLVGEDGVCLGGGQVGGELRLEGAGGGNCFVCSSDFSDLF